MLAASWSSTCPQHARRRSSSATDSPVLEKEAFNADAALGTTEGQEQAARVPRFTTVSPEVLLAIFTETEDDPETIARNVAIEKEIDHFLGISKDAQSSSSQQAIGFTPQRREAAALSSRYAVKAEDQFDTTRRRKNASKRHELDDLNPWNAAEPNASTTSDELLFPEDDFGTLDALESDWGAHDDENGWGGDVDSSMTATGVDNNEDPEL
ncbi:hypothetical protein CF328_g9151, partial [Tilletia controversa]